MGLYTFDRLGNLEPYSIIECGSLTIIEHEFVKNFPDSKTREKIFKGLLEYISDLSAFIGPSWTMWLDGSFTTQKRDPNDIDVVSIFNWTQDINDKIPIFGPKFTRYECKRKYKVDGYFIAIYPENHAKHKNTEADFEYWKNQFGYARPSYNDIANGRKNRKGIVEIYINS